MWADTILSLNLASPHKFDRYASNDIVTVFATDGEVEIFEALGKQGYSPQHQFGDAFADGNNHHYSLCSTSSLSSDEMGEEHGISIQELHISFKERPQSLAFYSEVQDLMPFEQEEKLQSLLLAILS